jgi:hypothetical protein
VQKREGQLRRIEGLDGKVKHDARVLADRIEHDRRSVFCHHLAHDLDRLGFETLQMQRQRARYLCRAIDRVVIIHKFEGLSLRHRNFPDAIRSSSKNEDFISVSQSNREKRPVLRRCCGRSTIEIGRIGDER